MAGRWLRARGLVNEELQRSARRSPRCDGRRRADRARRPLGHAKCARPTRRGGLKPRPGRHRAGAGGQVRAEREPTPHRAASAGTETATFGSSAGTTALPRYRRGPKFECWIAHTGSPVGRACCRDGACSGAGYRRPVAGRAREPLPWGVARLVLVLLPSAHTYAGGRERRTHVVPRRGADGRCNARRGD